MTTLMTPPNSNASEGLLQINSMINCTKERKERKTVRKKKTHFSRHHQTSNNTSQFGLIPKIKLMFQGLLFIHSEGYLFPAKTAYHLPYTVMIHSGYG